MKYYHQPLSKLGKSKDNVEKHASSLYSWII